MKNVVNVPCAELLYIIIHSLFFLNDNKLHLNDFCSAFNAFTAYLQPKPFNKIYYKFQINGVKKYVHNVPNFPPLSQNFQTRGNLNATPPPKGA